MTFMMSSSNDDKSIIFRFCYQGLFHIVNTKFHVKWTEDFLIYGIFFHLMSTSVAPPPPQPRDFQKRPVRVGLNQKDYFSLYYPLVYRDDLYVNLWQTKETTQSINKRLAPNELKVLRVIVITSSTQESLVLYPD